MSKSKIYQSKKPIVLALARNGEAFKFFKETVSKDSCQLIFFKTRSSFCLECILIFRVLVLSLFDV